MTRYDYVRVHFDVFRHTQRDFGEESQVLEKRKEKKKKDFEKIFDEVKGSSDLPFFLRWALARVSSPATKRFDEVENSPEGTSIVGHLINRLLDFSNNIDSAKGREVGKAFIDYGREYWRSVLLSVFLSMKETD